MKPEISFHEFSEFLPTFEPASLAMKKKILICPLDWGIGHATRSMPLIRAFLSHAWEVIIGGSGQSFFLLKQEFPQLTFVSLPGHPIRYSLSNGMSWTMIRQLPAMAAGYFRENQLAGSITEEYAVDVILSDNRYGVFAPGCFNIILSHQLNPILPGWLNVFHKPFGWCVHQLIRRFDLCWIFDRESEPSLSGKLSHPPGQNIPYRFIGTLSRFSGVQVDNISEKISLLILLSGPEPQRTLLENKMLDQLKEFSERSIVLLGVPASPVHYWLNEQVEVFSHLESSRLLPLICSAETVISRPGYSSIMDYLTLGCRAILVPTPGQTEQAYLARKLHDLGICFSMPQETFDLTYALDQSALFQGFNIEWNASSPDGFIEEVENMLLLKHQKP